MFHVPVGFKTCSHYCHIATGRVKRPRVAQEGLSSRQPWPPCEVMAPHAGELECRPATCASAPLSPGTGVRAVSESGFSKERLICVGAGRPIRWLPTRAGRSPSKRPKIQDPVFLFSTELHGRDRSRGVFQNNGVTFRHVGILSPGDTEVVTKNSPGF